MVAVILHQVLTSNQEITMELMVLIMVLVQQEIAQTSAQLYLLGECLLTSQLVHQWYQVELVLTLVQPIATDIHLVPTIQLAF